MMQVINNIVLLAIIRRNYHDFINTRRIIAHEKAHFLYIMIN